MPIQEFTGELDAPAIAEFSGETDQEKAERDKRPGFIKEVGRQLLDVPLTHLPAAVASAVEGSDIAPRGSITDRLIERARKKSAEYATEPGGDDPLLGGLLTREDVRGLGPSLGFSGAGALAGLTAGVPAAAVTTPLGGYAAGGAASYKASSNMAASQFLRDVRDKLSQDRGTPLSDVEWESVAPQYIEMADRYRTAEALPETLSNLAQFAILASPAGKFLPKSLAGMANKNLLTKGVTKLAGMTAAELPSEVVTQQLQQPEQVKAELTPGPERSLTSAADWLKSANEVAGPVALQTLIMGGAGGAGIKGYQMLTGRDKLLNDTAEFVINKEREQQTRASEPITATPEPAESYTREPDALRAATGQGELTPEDIDFLTRSGFARQNNGAIAILPAGRRRLKGLQTTQTETQNDRQNPNPAADQTPAVETPPATTQETDASDQAAVALAPQTVDGQPVDAHTDQKLQELAASPDTPAITRHAAIAALQARTAPPEAPGAVLPAPGQEAMPSQPVQSPAEVVDQGHPLPTRPPSARWTSDRGAIPGEPTHLLDVVNGDPDTAKAAIIEREVKGRGVLYELVAPEGGKIGTFGTLEQAAKAGESTFPAPTILGKPASEVTLPVLKQAAKGGPKAAVAKTEIARRAQAASALPESGATGSPAPAAADHPLRALVESLIKRRAAARQVGVERSVDTAIARAKTAMTGGEAKPGYFSNLAKMIKGKDVQTSQILDSIAAEIKNPTKAVAEKTTPVAETATPETVPQNVPAKPLKSEEKQGNVAGGMSADVAPKPSGKPRMAETADQLFAAIKKAGGGILHEGRILYPTVRLVAGGGDFRVGMDGRIERITADGMGVRDATKDEANEVHDAIEKDQAMVVLRSAWGGSGSAAATQSKDLQVLHSPSGNSFEQSSKPKLGTKPEQRPAPRVAESQAPAVSDSGDRGVATTREGGVPDVSGNIGGMNSEQTQSTELRQWLGGSVVTDNGSSPSEGGKPLLVYHSSPNAGINKFDPKKSRDIGVHFSETDLAKKFGDTTYSAYLKIENPAYISDIFSIDGSDVDVYSKRVPGSIDNALGLLSGQASELYALGYKVEKTWNEDRDANNINSPAFKRFWKKVASLVFEHGYDGFEYENLYEGGGRSWVVFHPDQIRIVQAENQNVTKLDTQPPGPPSEGRGASGAPEKPVSEMTPADHLREAARKMDEQTKAAVRPEPHQPSEVPPTADIGDRWERDRGAIPGEPMFTLDANPETGDGKAYITETETPGRGSVWTAAIADGETKDFSTLKEAATWAESQVKPAAETGGEGQQEPIARPEELNFQRAMDAHRGTSMVPDKRAQAVQQEFADDVNGLYDGLLSNAQTDKQKTVLRTEVERYKQGYLTHMHALLGAQSRTMSVMIAGPSNFPVARNQKRMDTVDRRREEFLEWRKKARQSVARAVSGSRSSEQVSEDAWAALKKDIDRNIATVKGVDDGSQFYTRSAFTNSISGKLQRIADGGDVTLVRRALDYIRERQAGMKKPFFAARNSVWSLGEKAQEAAAREAPKGAETVAEYDGASIVNNNDEQRVQILFDTIPGPDLRNSLKASGWRWSPSNQAWQRQNTDSAIASAKQIVGAAFKTKETDTGTAMFSRADDVAFAQQAVDELAANDELFRYPVSQSSDLETVFAEVAPPFKFAGNATRADEDGESGADRRFMFRTEKGRDFYVYERGRDVWIDVSKLDPGDGGNAIYAAILNYAHNARKRLVGDPDGLSKDAMIRRTSAMLSSALRFGTTRHMAPATEQRQGDAARGIAPLGWGANDFENVRSLIDTFLTTLYTQYPDLKGYRYDFGKRQFVETNGAPADLGRLLGNGDRPAGEGSYAGAGGQARGMAGEARAGEATLRRGIFLQSLVSSKGSERPGILEQVLNRARQLVGDGNLEGLFARQDQQTPQNAGFSVSDATARQAVVNAFGEKAAAGLEREGLINFVNSPWDFPTEIHPLMRGNEEAVYWKGKSWIVKSSSPSDIVVRVLHEVGEHHGLEAMLGREKYAQLQRRVTLMNKSGNVAVREAWAAVVKAEPDIKEGSERFISEVVARIGQDQRVQTQTWWRQLLDAIRAFIIKHYNIPAGKLTADHIQTLLRASVMAAAREQGQPSFMPGEGVAASRSGKIDQTETAGTRFSRDGEAAAPEGFEPDKAVQDTLSESPAVKAARKFLPERAVGWTKAIVNKLDAMSPLGTLPNQESYLTKRYLALGKLASVGEETRTLYEAFKDAGDVAPDVYAFLTTRDAKPEIIKDAALREKAVAAKNTLMGVGEKLVERGLLPREVFEAHKGEYLPRIYLKHLLDDDAIAALGSGKKPSNMGYLKARKDIPEDVRKLILGEITDPAYLVSKSYGTQMRDVVLLDWLKEISLETDWVLPMSMVEWEGRQVTPFYLKQTAKDIRRQALHYTPENRTAAQAIADSMDETADLALENYTGVPTDWKQIPSAPRYGEMRGLIVRQEIFDDIVGSARIALTDASLAEKVLGNGGMATKMTQLWKWSKVAANPPAQIRNFISNGILMHLSGVKFHMVLPRMVEAIRDIRTNGKYWQIAKKYGITESTFSSQELFRVEREFLDLQARNAGTFSLATVKNLGAKLMSATGDVYQFSEALFKTAKIIDAMKKGATEEKAIMEAQKWLFDYSLVTPSMRYLRNAPIGAPFITFYFKALPRMLEVATQHPLRLAPYMALPFVLTAMVASMADVDDDDVDKLKKALPRWMQERGHAYFLPAKDDKGRWVAMDFGYFLPWTMWTELGSNLAKGEFGDAMQSSGLLGGPLPDIIAAIKTNKDPFSKKEIVNEFDPPARQAAALMGYVYSMAMPTWLTNYGFAGHMYSALNDTVDKHGQIKDTEGQAMLRLFGVNLYPVNPEVTRAENIKRMRFEIQAEKRRMTTQLRDRNLSTEKRQEIAAEYRELIQKRTKDLMKYAQESRVHPNLRTGARP